jgi:pyruvate ferredoxin oxidoreductase alpha subunit
MLRQIEGSKAVAEAVAACRPEVICAYPISPQTHIVEELSRIVKAGELPACEYVNVESEFAAMSVAIGASAAGARAYTATSSQGLLFMTEAVYNAAGLGLPIVMTVANRAIGAPINIWNDHSDAMAMRDAGWLQLYAETNQEAADLHVQAFRIGEELSLPVMVCMDGFVLTHAVERVDVPEAAQVEPFLPPFTPRQVLDPDDPYSIGSLVGPEAFTEVRYFAHLAHVRAPEVVSRVAAEFREQFGRDSGGLVRTYRCDDADTIVIAMGSALGTIKDVVDAMRDDGVRVGVLGITSFRPFPLETIRRACLPASRVVVVDRALSPGLGGPVAGDVGAALHSAVRRYSVIAGLGGRPITTASLREVLDRAVQDRLDPLTFLDLNESAIETHTRSLAGFRGLDPVRHHGNPPEDGRAKEVVP